jgi:hypothetical protein
MNGTRVAPVDEGVWTKRQPDFGVATKFQESESRGQHAHHLVRAAVERNAAPDDRRITPEPPLPEAVRDDDHGPGRGSVFGGEERAAPSRRDAQQFEEVRRRDGVLHLFRLVGCEVESAQRPRRHAVEHLILLLNISKIRQRERQRHQPLRRPCGRQQHETIGVCEGKRSKQHGISYAEQRGVGADPERQRDERGDRHRRSPQQRADGVANVVQQCLFPFSLPIPSSCQRGDDG